MKLMCYKKVLPLIPSVYAYLTVHLKWSVSLTVCSTTLWVGQLDKRTHQQDVACLLEEFGEIDSINVSFDMWRSVTVIQLVSFVTMAFVFFQSKDEKNTDFYLTCLTVLPCCEDDPSAWLCLYCHDTQARCLQGSAEAQSRISQSESEVHQGERATWAAVQQIQRESGEMSLESRVVFVYSLPDCVGFKQGHKG